MKEYLIIISLVGSTEPITPITPAYETAQECLTAIHREIEPELKPAYKARCIWREGGAVEPEPVADEAELKKAEGKSAFVKVIYSSPYFWGRQVGIMDTIQYDTFDGCEQTSMFVRALAETRGMAVQCEFRTGLPKGSNFMADMQNLTKILGQ